MTKIRLSMKGSAQISPSVLNKYRRSARVNINLPDPKSNKVGVRPIKIMTRSTGRIRQSQGFYLTRAYRNIRPRIKVLTKKRANIPNKSHTSRRRVSRLTTGMMRSGIRFPHRPRISQRNQSHFVPKRKIRKLSLKYV